MKSNTKSWFDIDVLNTIRNRDKHFTKFKLSGKEIYKNNIKNAKFLFKKVLEIIRNFTLKKKLQKIRTILKNSGEL